MTDALAASPVGRAIGVALVQFLWQGAAIGLATALLLAALRRASAHTGYVVACAGLLVMMIAPAVTVSRVLRDSPVTVAIAAPSPAGQIVAVRGIALDSTRALSAISRVTALAAISGWTAWSRLTEPYFPVIVVVWAAGVLLLSIRLLATWLLVERIRRRSNHPWAQADAWDQRVQTMARALRVTRPVQIVESSLVAVPSVIGWLRPLILLPASAFAGLSPSQLEAVLAHELAHIRRHDYLVNLLQNVVETLLFFHPAVWWLSRRIRIEREHCCDDLAVDVCGDRMTYAEALTSLAELRSATPALGMAASGGSLVGRIRRLIERPGRLERQSSAWLIGAMVLAAIFVTSIGAAKTRQGAFTAAFAARSTMAGTAPSTPPAPIDDAAPVAGPTPSSAPLSAGHAAGLTMDQARRTQAPGTVMPEGAQILAAEERFRRAKLDNDLPALAAIFDDAYVGTNQNGNRYDKAQELALWKTFHISSLVVDPAKVGRSGNNAVVMGTMTEVNATGTDRMLFTRVWRHDDRGVWRLLSGTQFRDPQATEVPASEQTPDKTTGPASFGWPQSNAAQAGISETWTTYAADSTPGVSTPPRLLNHVTPVYPQVALAAGVEGSPTLEFVIDLNGDVSDTRIIRHVPLLDQASLDAVRQWRFIPSSVDGRLYPMKVTLTFDFKLRK